MHWLRKAIGISLLAVGMPMAFAVVHVLVASWGRVVDVQSVPQGSTVIVFGAEAFSTGPSDFLRSRLDVAVGLVESGRAERIVVSGDGRAIQHDEPATMRRYLEQRGVAPAMIIEDPHGHDTYDTCWRASREFGVTSAVLVSQDYHVRRTIATCRALGVESVGVPDTTMRSTWPMTWGKGAVREAGALLKMEWDLLSGRDAATLE